MAEPRRFQNMTVIQPTEDMPARLVALDTEGNIWVSKDISPFPKWYPMPLEV